jgi:ATP-binding cassette subfamily G (WHITE) protein 2 (PDR)
VRNEACFSRIPDKFFFAGGERKRVTIAEAALSEAPLASWDNSTRGLDSANALEFCRSLRLQAELLQTTSCVAIYQSPQSAYNLFDKVTVLYEGRQIYFGPIHDAKTFFLEMGFDCPHQQTTPDFLTSLTSPLERQVRHGFEDQVPRTPDEFVARWKASGTYKVLIESIDEYERTYPVGGKELEQFKHSRRAQQAKNQNVKSPFTLSYVQQIQLCLWRGWQRLKGDPSLTYAQLFGNACMGLVVSSLFFNLSHTTSSFYTRSALLFFSILLSAFASVGSLGVAPLPLTFV